MQKLHLQADKLSSCGTCAVLMLREVAGEEEAGADRQGGALAGAPEYAVQLAAHRAALHPAELQELQRVLDAQGTRLPKELFDSSNAELLRYAATHGLLEVRSPFLAGLPVEPLSAPHNAASIYCDSFLVEHLCSRLFTPASQHPNRRTWPGKGRHS